MLFETLERAGDAIDAGARQVQITDVLRALLRFHRIVELEPLAHVTEEALLVELEPRPGCARAIEGLRPPHPHSAIFAQNRGKQL
ncbi:MAG TPA: hypothetical protein VFF06_34770 [Polyangia bacterium]|nr:hypothetical protein [Polyangia bacterium]